MIARSEQSATLQDLAKRLCPNPALTEAGTLLIILDGIARLDKMQLAKSIARAVKGKELGGDPGPVSAKSWADADPKMIQQYLDAAETFKMALYLLAGDA